MTGFGTLDLLCRGAIGVEWEKCAVTVRCAGNVGPGGPGLGSTRSVGPGLDPAR